MFSDLRTFFALVGATVAGLAGLFMAAHAELENSYYLGLAVFFLAVIVGAIVIRRALDQADV